MSCNDYCGLPFKCGIVEYEKAIDDVVFEAKANQSVAGIFRMGRKIFPGFSDLDLVIIYKYGGRPLRAPSEISVRCNQIFTHRFISVDEVCFQNFFYIYPHMSTSLEHIWGDVKPPRQVIEGDLRKLLEFQLFQIVLQKVLPLYFSKRWVHIRESTGAILSLSYTVDILRTIGISGSNLFDPTEMVNKFRESWRFDFEKFDHIGYRELCLNGTMLCKSIIEAVFNHYNFGSPVHYETRKLGLISEGGSTGVRRIHSVQPLFSALLPHAGLYVVPEAVSLPLFAISRGEGKLSQAVRRHMRCKGEADADAYNYFYTQSVRRSIDILNQLTELSLLHGGQFRVPFLHGLGLFDLNHTHIARLAIDVRRMIRSFVLVRPSNAEM